MSSPGGGFYKYRCKYFLSHDCKNWVWVNDTPCSTCLANGRDEETYPTAAWAASRDIMAPYVKNGVLQYAHMEVTVSEQGEESLIIRSKAVRPPPAMPVTTMMPRGGSIMASAH
ncbi:hypothetical protein LMH87_000428 [Akanthomyces muscarius]|uniref:Uncharacterized protein n=1 Tax=Akanthomyces muscarius TaxID=2231603 RepID=A0A9W8QFA9_AKAMU|nr:hypothetical protein LMH87_000428 [Akanthomyces muscarius]KAJ4155171.1 hypothetical protein LMH87_000428 [Akanthomyces muscarius]